MAETLPTLPDVQFVDTAAQPVVDVVLDGYKDASGRTLADGDPVRLFLLSLAYIIASQRAQIDGAGKSNLLYYARGAFLDHIGLSRKTLRIDAEAARCTQQFTLSAARLVPTVIPAGTRVTADNEIYWETTAQLTIAAGQTQGTVPVEALTAGAAGNAVAAGGLTSLVDPVPYVASTANTTPGQGGRDREDDDPYRYRIYMAPAAFSVAGPVDAYKYLAYSAHADIADVVAHSPTPGVAEIRPLLTGGVIPQQAILDAVAAVLTAKDVRPLCDKVEVKAPAAKAYAITLTWYLHRENQSLQEQIAPQVQAALQDYIAWQRAKCGRDIDPGELNARMRAAGAKRVVIASPVYTALAKIEVAQEGAVSLTFGGVEDD